MKRKALAIFFLFFGLVGFIEDVPAWGPITHMTILDEILKDQRLNSDIKKILQDNLKYAKGGVVGPDMFYFNKKRYSDIAHYCSPGDLARKMLEMAKKDGDPKKIAFAYGWMIHVVTDSIGHPWVNSLAGGEYDPNNATIKKNHSHIEQSIDKKNYIEHAKKLTDPITGAVLVYYYDMDIDSPDIFTSKVFLNLFGCSENAPPPYMGEDAENISQFIYHLYPNWIIRKDENEFNTAEYQEAYEKSISQAIGALNTSGEKLKNWDLDSGEAPYSEDENGQIIHNPKYKGHEKCKKQTQLKDCGPVTRPSPGRDHPDDTVSVGDGILEAESALLNSLFRLAPQKEMRWVLWLKAIQDANTEYSNLPLDAPAELRKEKLDKLSFLANQLNDPYDFREFSINNPQIQKEIEETPDVAILQNGYFEEMAILINKNSEPVRVVSLNLNPEIFKNHPVLVIPSGGLYGLENSEIFKASLDEYVKSGGTLIVFAQQHGYEFSVLPVPQEADGSYKTIGGYGWSEDQSCFVNAAYIETWHQMLAGQSKSTPTLHLDGYFTTYPSNATVILRRTANGQPALLMYEYGQGQVILTSMYSDFALKQNQASSEEIALIRDMISWAKSPTVLPEVRPGETVSVSVEVKNITINDAELLKVLIYNPSRSILLSEQTISGSIPAGQSVTIPITFGTMPTSPLGIYHIDYTLLDAQGNIIQPQAETDSGRFVVSNPPQSPVKVSQLTFSIQSDSEDYVAGSTVNLTIIAFNNSDIDQTVTAKVHDFPIRTETMVVPAKGSSSFIYSKIAWGERVHWGHRWGSLRVSFYDEDNKFLGSSLKIYWVHSPSVKTTVQTDKRFYKKGETVTINISLKNNIPFGWTPTVGVAVTEPPRYTIVFEDSKTVTLSPLGTASLISTFILPSDSKVGTYPIQVFPGTLEYAYTRFEVVQSQISTTPRLPSAFNPGANTLSFTLTNTGKIDVSSGVFNLALKDPDGGIIYSGSQPFSIAVGESKVLDVSISMPALKFGDYTLTFAQSDETREGNPVTISIPNFVNISSDFDKPSHRVRETAKLTVNLTNSGRFNLENLSLAVSSPELTYADIRPISLGVSRSATSLDFEIPIPEAISAGLHNVEVALRLSSGSSLIKTVSLNVPRSALNISYSGADNIGVGDTINVTITNTGGVDTGLSYLVTLTGNGVAVLQNTGDDTLRVGEIKSYSLQIPSQSTEGNYVLSVECLDKKTNQRIRLKKNLTVSGLRAELTLRTNKDLFLPSENIGVLSQVVNQVHGIENGHLHLEIVNRCSSGMLASYHFFTWDGSAWVDRATVHYPNNWETRLIDLSPFLPDPSGEFKVRIRHVGEDHAEIDSIGLVADGILYTPDLAFNLSTHMNILGLMGEGDGWSAYVLNNEIEVQWTEVPVSSNVILLMRAREGEVGYSPCEERVYWQAVVPITQATHTTENLSHNAPPLYESGQFYLQGQLVSQTGQVIRREEYRFHVIDGDLGLRFHTDKSIYREGESIQITGDVVNLSLIQVTDITVRIYDLNWEILYEGTFDLYAKESRPFSFIIPAGSRGIYQLNGRVYQNMSMLASLVEKYVVDVPTLSAAVDAPTIAGHESFSLDVSITNGGKIPATVQMSLTGGSLLDTQAITIKPNETRLVQYNQTITSDTTYTIDFSGDLIETITKTISYGLGGSIQFGVGSSELGIFPEGTVAVPITITNTGQLAETLEISFDLSPGDVKQGKTYSLAAGTSIADTLYFNLPEGDYQITATSQSPEVFAQANFSVRKENQVEMTLSFGTQTEGLIPINVNLTNLGFNDINGSVNVSVTGGSGQVVWNAHGPFSELTPQDSQLIHFNINPSVIEPGNYTLQTQLLNNSSQVIAVRSREFGVRNPAFQMMQLPPYQTFMAGQEASFTFRVKNTGDQEGSFDLRLKAYDLIDSTQREWLRAGEEKTVSFSFMLPEDLEEKDYFASYELKDSRGQGVEGSRGQIKYHLAAIHLNVNATLDKPYYSEGETAHLTINIQTQNPAPQNLFARVNYAGYESQQAFTIGQGQAQPLQFDIPLVRITGEKLFYGIYHEGGRSIHLNSLYIHKAGDVITITTDKQVYQPGETVSVTVSGNESGDMTLSGPGGYAETFAYTGSATKSFTLPATLTAGTYFINAQLTAPNSELVTTVYPFDIAGIQVKVIECQNDKGKYASTDTINTSLTISSNTAMPAVLKAWLVDPQGNYAAVGEQNINLSSSENLLVTHHSSLITMVSGIHRLVYGIYGPEDLLLCSGSEAFDVGDAVLMGISIDKRDYPTNTEPVIVTASLFGSVSAELQLELDGTLIKAETISLNGFISYTTHLQDILPGPHILKATLTAAGLKSTKEISFTYALSFMPKPQISASAAYLDFGSINLESTSIQTITLTSTGNADLVIGTMALSGTNQGEFSIQNNTCSGRAISPSGTCTLDILFSPTSLGSKSALLTIPSNAHDMPMLALILSGTGAMTLNISINPAGSGRVTGTGIDCPGDCTERFATLGATIQLAATPTEGYRFLNWTGDINLTENIVTLNMDAQKTVTANFAPNAYTINTGVSPGGAIDPSGQVPVNHGASQTFIITPWPGYHVAEVKVDGVSVGAVLAYTFDNVNSDHTIEAIFAINQYTITATAGPNGTILPLGTITVNHGANQTFGITPDSTYCVADVKVDGVSVGAVTIFTFNNITANHTIEATFKVENSPPIAHAGPDQNVITNQVVTLNGSESFDPEGAMITFCWTFIEVPTGSRVANGSLSDANSAKPQFTPDVNGSYRLQLVVNDGLWDSLPDEVIIYVTAPNVAPNAHAGPDQNVLTGRPVPLDGSISNDPDNGPLPLSYLWNFVSKPTGSLLMDAHILNRDRPYATFSPDVSGLYELRLTVNDGDLSSEDMVQIIVTTPNVPPNANAGEDISINLGEKAFLNGSASRDPDNGPQPLTFLWTFVTIPTGSNLGNGTIYGAYTDTPSFAPDVAGTYVLQLRVSDGIDAGYDNVAVTVLDNKPPALSPIANLTTLWPPDHRMVDIIIKTNASDNTGQPVTLSAMVKSNEPQDGLGDGDTSPDWTEPVIDQINGIITLKLRAERSGRGTGRIYTITVIATDPSGNSSQAKVEIKVPHHKGKERWN